MDTNGEKLKKYMARNQKFWPWPSGVKHEVVFLGCDDDDFKLENGLIVPTVLYRFRLVNGREMSRHIRAIKFAEIMSTHKAGDRLTVKRTPIGKGKYHYEVDKLD